MTMLQTIRNNSQGLLAKIFIGFVILVFALFGLDSIVGTIVNSNSTVSVNGVDLNELAIENEAQRISQQLLSNLGANIDPGSIDPSQFREQAVNNLVERELIFQTAVENNMTLSPAELDRQIAQTAEFQVNGSFSIERARALLASFGMTPAGYRAALLREGLMDQMLSSYSDSSFATPAEIEMVSRINNQQRTLRHIRIPVEMLTQTQTVTDDEISQYYDENPEQYMQGERVAIEYVVLDRQNLMDEIEVSEDEIRAQYNTEIASLESAVERRASHILLQASDDTINEAMTQAQELKSRIDNGESFEDLAAEFSDDTGSAQFGGDVGYTSGDTFAEPFENALAQLELEQVSDPVRTQFGVHLIKLTELSESDIPEFEESRDRIETELQEQAVDDIYIARAEELGNLAFESLDLEQPAESLGLEIQTTELFDRSGGVGIAANQSVIDAAFGAEVRDGLNSALLTIDDSRTAVIRELERREPELRPLAEVSGQIEASLRREKARQEAQTLGQSYLNSLENGQNIDALLSVQGLQWQNTQALSRNDTSLPAELRRMIFEMPKPAEGETEIQGGQLQNGDYVIIQLQEIIPGSLAEMPEEEQLQLKNYLLQQEAVADFNAVMSGVQARADIQR